MIYLDNNTLLQEIYIPRQDIRNDASPEYATKTELENAIENEVIRADGKYATKTDLLPYATTGWVESQDFATEEWVEEQIQSAITSETARTEETYQKISEMSAYSTTIEVESMIDDAVSGKMDTSAMSAYSTTEQVEDMITAATDGLASEEWVNDQGFLKEHQSLSAYSTTQQMNTAINNATSGKMDTSAMSAYTPTSGFATINGSAITEGGDIVIQGGGAEYSAGTNIEIVDNVISVTGITIPTSNTAFTNDAGYITSGDAQTQIDNSISGKVDTSAMTYYWTSAETESAIQSATEDFVTSADVETQIEDKHYITGYTETDPVFMSSPASGITANDITNWNSKQPAGDYALRSELPTVPTSNTAFTNDAGYITDAALNGYATTAFTEQTYLKEHQSLSAYSTTEQMNTAIENATSGLASETYVDNAVSGKADTSALTEYATTGHVQDVEDHIDNMEEMTAIALLDLKANKADATALTEYAKAEHVAELEQVTSAALNNLAENKADSSAVSASIAAATAATTGWVENQGYLTAFTESDPVFMSSAASGITANDIQNWNSVSGKQDTLISGTNIKTINNESILGSGNINISGGSGTNIIELTQAEYDALTAYTEDAMYVITDAQEINMDNYATTGDLGSYYTSAQTDTAISNAVSGKTDKVSVTANTGRQFPRWNSQGVVTGTTGNTVYEQSLNINGTSKTMLQTTNSSFGTIYAPTTAGTAGQPLLSNGSGAPVWGSYKFQFLSQSQYDSLATKDSTTIYFIVNEN